MKTVTQNTGKQVSTKKASTNKIESKSIDLLKAISTKKAKKESTFKAVQTFNREFKEEFASLGRILSNLIQFDKETKGQKLEATILAKIKLCKENKNGEYKTLLDNVKPNSKGLYSSYKVLMYLRK